jgi:hypothetical protein
MGYERCAVLHTKSSDCEVDNNGIDLDDVTPRISRSPSSSLFERIEESINGLLSNNELDGLREMRGVTSSRSIPLLSTVGAGLPGSPPEPGWPPTTPFRLTSSKAD